MPEGVVYLVARHDDRVTLRWVPFALGAFRFKIDPLIAPVGYSVVGTIVAVSVTVQPQSW